MRSMQEPPMHSEDDLRAVLAEMERYAPDVGRVLREVRGRAGPRRGPGWFRILAPRGTRSPRWPRLVAGVAVAAALAGLVIALAPGVLPAGRSPAAGTRPAPTPQGLTQPGPSSAGSQRGLPSAASIGRAMLTAGTAANDDILYTSETGISHGVVVDTYRYWSWPAQPVTGQLERTLNVYSQRDPASAPLLLTEVDEFNYIVPPGDPEYVKGHLTVVCYPTPGSKPGGCGYGNISTPPGSYSVWDRRFINPNPGLDDLRPSALAQEVSQGKWRVIRRARFLGQPGIELAETPKGIYRPLPTTLWVNARSRLPLRMFSGGTVVGWSFLKPTPANMTRLNAQIPAGYRHSSGS
jgi:hypothetical protein